MIRALLIGYGKMGKQIAHLAPQFRIAISHVVDNKIDENTLPKTAQGFEKLTPKILENCDVVIDFSSPDHILSRIELLAEAQKPVIVGTTGWQKHEEEARAIIKQHNATLLTSPNFSLGVQLFLYFAKEMSRVCSHFPQYDVGLFESHHRKKQDAPSGTALLLANKVLEEYPNKKLVVEPSRTHALNEDEIHLGWQRTGAIPGTHELVFDSSEDTISLSHVARNREGFAKGALESAFWVIDKKGWFTLDDMIRQKLRR